MRRYKFKNHSLVGMVVIAQLMLLDVSAQADIAQAKIAFADSNICSPDRIDIPSALKDAPAGDPNEQPTLIKADEVESEPNVIRLSGNAQATQGKRGIYAEQITYDKRSNQATATHNVRFYTARGDEVLADSLHLQMDTATGVAQNVRAQFVDELPPQTSRTHHNYLEDYSLLAPFRNKGLPATEPSTTDNQTYVRFRATADRIEFDGVEHERLYNTRFSSCTRGNEDVVLQAKEIELDYTAGVGTAKSIVVKFKRIPLLYLPIASFPITSKRKSGFLIPDIRSERASGIIISAPYYINIAPNYDATVIPKIVTKRGVQLYGEYRYLTQQSAPYQSSGIIKAEVLPADAVFKRNRYALIYQHKQDFNDNWSGGIDFQRLSDTHYLEDFSSGFGATSLSYVPQRADLLYQSSELFFKASLSAYQTVNSNVSVTDAPYSRLPEINLNLKPRELGSFKYGIESDFTHFKLPSNRPSGRLSGRATGTRLRTKPHISFPIHRSYGYVIPKISLQTIDYTLDSGNLSSISVPIISVDSGLFFERTFERKDARFFQTLEPRLFYVKIPPKLKQEIRPNFDSGIRENNSFSHLFRENRFFGGDRVGDTHQITLGLTSRITDSVGKQRLKVSLGQIFFLDRREVGLSNTTPPETQNQSSFVTEITATVTEDWDIRTFTRIDKANTVEFARISVDYYHSPRRNATIGYSLDKDSSEQVNLAFQLPIARRWQIDGEGKYSTRQSEIREFAVGINYDSCCWAVKLLAERSLVGIDKFQNRFTIALELGVLGRVRHHE